MRGAHIYKRKFPVLPIGFRRTSDDIKCFRRKSVGKFKKKEERKDDGYKKVINLIGFSSELFREFIRNSLEFSVIQNISNGQNFYRNFVEKFHRISDIYLKFRPIKMVA